MPRNKTKDYWPDKENEKAYHRIQRKIKKAIKKANLL